MPHPQSYVESSWYETYYDDRDIIRRQQQQQRRNRTARGVRHPSPPRDDATSTDSTNGDNTSFLFAWATGMLSAGISYYAYKYVRKLILSQEREQDKDRDDQDDDTKGLSASILSPTTTTSRFLSEHSRQVWSSTKILLGQVPTWFWLTAPAYVTLLVWPEHRDMFVVGTFWTFFQRSHSDVIPCHRRLDRRGSPYDEKKEGNDMNSEAETVDNRPVKKDKKQQVQKMNLQMSIKTRTHPQTVGDEKKQSSTNDAPKRQEQNPPQQHVSLNSEEDKSSLVRAIIADEFGSRDSSKPPLASAVSIKKSSKQRKEAPPLKYLELMVHNVSHTDLILNLDCENKNESMMGHAGREQGQHYVRPRFSSFDLLCRLLYSHLSESDQVISFPRYHRSMDDPRYSIQEVPTTEQDLSPTGLCLARPASLPANISLETDLRMREPTLFSNGLLPENPRISHVYFPLLATILPVWQRQIGGKEYHSPVKRVLILVTGVGTPRNWTHSISGNSTRICADLMQAFLARIDPSLTVIKIHSETNIFRYDENLLFVERELMPTINAFRDAHATGQPYPEDVPDDLMNPEVTFDDNEWRSTMHVTLSFADGSPARTHAIQASIRPYKPSYFHFWQLKTFWHESKVVDDDIEVHSFEAMETLPAIDPDRIRDTRLQLVVQEMRSFYEEMLMVMSNNSNDIRRFWLRKTHKPVLAVLLVQSAGMEPQLYRGTNMEVSMPTGSLCAERNAIGSALAANPNLKRKDLKLIACLAVPPVETVSDVSENTKAGMRRIHSYSSLVEEHSESRAGISNSRKSSIASENDPGEDWVDPMNTSQTSSVAVDEEIDSTPVRRISLFSKTPSGTHTSKRTVVVHTSKDKNPLAPCGACHEWLKKIAESNPYFKIVTFTDANCNGIYVTPCQGED